MISFCKAFYFVLAGAILLLSKTPFIEAFIDNAQLDHPCVVLLYFACLMLLLQGQRCLKEFTLAFRAIKIGLRTSSLI